MSLNLRDLKRVIASEAISQTELAKRSGISRSRLNALLANPRARVRGTTLQRLKEALDAKGQRGFDARLLDRYKRLLSNELGELQFQGLGIPYVDTLPLESLYVSLWCRERFRWTAKPCVERDEGASAPRISEQSTLPFQQLLHRFDRLVLLGDPGSGKTTLLRHVACSFARNEQGKNGYPGVPLLPLFISLSKLAQAQRQDGGDKSVDPAGLAAVWLRAADRTDESNSANAEDMFRGRLEQGACLVLLDGLDEVSEGPIYAQLLQSLVAFIERYPNNRFVLTSRVIGFEEEPWRRLRFAALTIEDWTDAQIQEFTRKWMAAKHRHASTRKCVKCRDESEKLWQAIDAHSGVKAIATNPLLLTILASLHHARIVFPRRRVELYERIVDARLETWERAKETARPGDPLHNLSLDGREYGWLLGALAVRMQELDLSLAQRWWMTEFIQEFLQQRLGFEVAHSKAATDRIIAYLTERSGLLIERGADLFGFAHLTFQEYFASRGLLDDAQGRGQTLLARLRPYLFHPRWREVIRLLAAKLTPAQAPKLFRALLEDPDPLGRFLRRGAILAIECLADGAPVPDRLFLDELFGGMLSLGESKWIGITLEVLAALRSLRGTRLEQRAVEAANAIMTTAASALDEDDIACLTQTDVPGLVEAARAALESAPDAVGEAARGALLETLNTNERAGLRECAAVKLGRLAKNDESVAAALQRRLDTDESSAVKAACAASLEDLVSSRPSLREKLASLLSSEADGEVRAGCVSGLRKVVENDRQIFALLVRHLETPKEDIHVRVQCIWGLQPFLGTQEAVTDLIIKLLHEEQSSILQRVAAQCLAEALSENRIAWSEELVDSIQTVLMNLVNPCPHALEALVTLADAKQVHGGLQLETVLRTALKPFRARLVLAFVFGSIARDAQNADSDIDICLIGQVGLKELSTSLETAEHTLGRRVSPVIYSPESFRLKVASGDPFLLDVWRRDKIFLKGTNDELREMVADRLVATP